MQAPDLNLHQEIHLEMVPGRVAPAKRSKLFNDGTKAAQQEHLGSQGNRM